MERGHAGGLSPENGGLGHRLRLVAGGISGVAEREVNLKARLNHLAVTDGAHLVSIERGTVEHHLGEIELARYGGDSDLFGDNLAGEFPEQFLTCIKIGASLCMIMREGEIEGRLAASFLDDIPRDGLTCGRGIGHSGSGHGYCGDTIRGGDTHELTFRELVEADHEGEGMNDILRHKFHLTLLVDNHRVTGLADRNALPGFESVEERRRDGVEQLGVTFGVGMVDVIAVLETVGPFARTVVDCPEEVDRGNIPAVDKQVHTAHISVIRLLEVATGVVVHHHRHHPVLAGLGNQQLHIVGELVVDSLLV